MKQSSAVEPITDARKYVLETNRIGAIWQICFIANNFVFPVNAFFGKEYDISRVEFVILFVLSHRDGLMAWEICRMTNLPKNNVSRGANKLEQKGHIRRTGDPKDARRALLSLTESGWALFNEMIKHYMDRAQSILNLLDADDQRALDRITIKLSNALVAKTQD